MVGTSPTGRLDIRVNLKGKVWPREIDIWEVSVYRNTVHNLRLDDTTWDRVEPWGAPAFMDLEEETNPRKEPEKEWPRKKEENQERVVFWKPGLKAGGRNQL